MAAENGRSGVDGDRPDVDFALLDALPHMAWVGDPEGRVLYVNERFCRYAGRDRAWVREHGWQALVHPDDNDAADAAWSRAIATGEPYEHEYRLRRQDGTYRWHLDRGEVDPTRGDGHATRWVGTWTDVHERHLADAALADSRRRVDEQLALLDALYRHAPIGLGFLDRDLRLVRANEVLLASRDPAERTLGMNLRDLAPDLWHELAPIVDQVVAGRQTVDGIEVSAPDIDDPLRTRWWSVGYYPVELDGEVLGVGTVSQDRTEQVERLQRLQSSEELWSLAERAADLGSWEQDLRTGRSRWSRGLYEVLGLGTDVEPDPEVFVAQLREEDRQTFRAAVRHVLATQQPVTSRYRLVRPDGSERIVEGRGSCDVEDGRVVRVFGTTQDVTDQVRTWERVERSERLLTEAETVAEMGSFEVMLPSGDTVFSPGLRALLEYEGEELVPPDVWGSYVHPDDVDRQAEEMRRVIETGVMSTFTLRAVLPGGRVRLLELRGSCYRDADGVPSRLVGTALDITERERLRQEREVLLERTIGAADRERQRIAEHLHDDTVQALIAALLRLDHAQATGSTEPLGRARATLEVAVRSLRLNIMELAPVDLDDGIEAAIAAYAEQLLEVDAIPVRLRVEVGDERAIPPELLLTSYRIIREALSNVRRHAGAGEVAVALHREGDRLVGEVTDDGVGVDPELTARPGHLGTRLMRERAELAGGQVTIGSRASGSGTTVRFALPL